MSKTPPNTFVLPSELVTRAYDLAQATYEKWKLNPGHYKNLLRNHRAGKLGEVGLSSWLSQAAVEAEDVFADLGREREADIIAGSTRIEVKTWSSNTWEEMGRCVRPGQMKSLVRRADVVVWCVLEQSEKETRFTVKGWSPVGEVEAAPVTVTGPNWQRIENHQLQESQLKAPQELLNLLQGA